MLLRTKEAMVPQRFLLGNDYELDLGAYELRRLGRPLKLPRIPMEVLRLLVEQRGQLVAREQIVERVWGKELALDTDNSINAAIRKIRQALQDDPEQPKFLQTVTGKGYRFIATVSIPEEELPEQPLPVESWWKRRRVSVLAGSLLLAMVFGLVVVRQYRAKQAAAVVKSRRSVAVLGLRNLSGKSEHAWISTALAEMLSTELASGRQLRVISSEDVAKMKLDLGLPAAESYGRETLGKIRSNVSADVVVLGSYLDSGQDSGGKLRVDLQLQDAVLGETVAAVSEEGSEAELAEVVSRAGAKLRQQLGIAVAASDVNQGRSALPSNALAARLYSEGLDKLRVFDAMAARDLLEKAVATDPKHALSHAALAECWSALGWDAYAIDEAKQAFDLSTGLPREEQLSIEGRYRELTNDWPKASEIYRALYSFFPDNTNYGLSLAAAQTMAGRGQDAIATTETLRKLPSPEGADARIDIAEAKAAGALSDFRQQQALAAVAIGKARAMGARLLLAEALAVEAKAFEGLGQFDKALMDASEAQRFYNSSVDRRGSATMEILAGDVFEQTGNWKEAKSHFDGAQAIFRAIGDQRDMGRALDRIGNVLYDRGQLEEAQAYYEKALEVDRGTKSLSDVGTDLNHLANVFSDLGQFEKARGHYEEALGVSREAGNKRGTVEVMANLGVLLLNVGDLDGAKKQVEGSMALAREIGYRSGELYQQVALGDLLFSQDKVAEAQDQYQTALSLAKELGDTIMVGEIHISLSAVAGEAGRYSDGVSFAQQAATELEGREDVDGASRAYSMQARNLLAEGHVAEAEAALKRAPTLAASTGSRGAHFERVLASARAKAQSGRTADALADLETLLATASKIGFRPYEYRARLAIVDIERQSTSPTKGRVRLADLEKDARAHGFLLIARKAASAMNSSGAGGERYIAW